MISTAEAARQALRLTGLRGIPDKEEAHEELTEAIRQSSRDLEHAGRIINSWLRSNSFWPTPAEIYTIAQSTDRETDPSAWTCAHCDGTGFERCWQLITWRSGNSKDSQWISHKQYLDLCVKISSAVGKKLDFVGVTPMTGVVGEQVAIESRKRCVHCSIGRRRAEAEQAEK